MRVSVSVRGDTAERWEAVRDELEERLGYRPSHADTVRLVLAGFDADQITNRE